MKSYIIQILTLMALTGGLLVPINVWAATENEPSRESLILPHRPETKDFRKWTRGQIGQAKRAKSEHAFQQSKKQKAAQQEAQAKDRAAARRAEGESPGNKADVAKLHENQAAFHTAEATKLKGERKALTKGTKGFLRTALRLNKGELNRKDAEIKEHEQRATSHQARSHRARR